MKCKKRKEGKSIIKYGISKIESSLVDDMNLAITQLKDYVCNSDRLDENIDTSSPDYNFRQRTIDYFKEVVLCKFDRYYNAALDQVEEELANNQSISPERRENFLDHATMLIENVRKYGICIVEGKNPPHTYEELKNKEKHLKRLAKSLSKETELFYEQLIKKISKSIAGQKQTDPIGISRPLSPKKWAAIFDVSERTVRRWKKNGDKYHFDEVSARLWRLPLHELPVEYLHTYRELIPKKT